MSVNPISWESMQAYFSLNEIEPEEWELNLIDRLDDVVLEHYAKQQKKQADASKAKSKSKTK